MMKWLKEQNRLTREFVRGDFSSQLWMSGVAFAVLLVLGVVLGIVLEDFASTFTNFFAANLTDAGIMDENGKIQLLPLLANNIRASIATIAYGLIPFLYLPALSLGINSLLIGFFAAIYLTNGMSMLYFFAAIIPHGIIEIPALIFSIALGLYLCRTISDYARQNTKGMVKTAALNILRVFCLRTAPLFVFASIIESYVTPWILSLI
jgi:stage II sporulation protein M